MVLHICLQEIQGLLEGNIVVIQTNRSNQVAFMRCFGKHLLGML